MLAAGTAHSRSIRREEECTANAVASRILCVKIGDQSITIWLMFLHAICSGCAFPPTLMT